MQSLALFYHSNMVSLEVPLLSLCHLRLIQSYFSLAKCSFWAPLMLEYLNVILNNEKHLEYRNDSNSCFMMYQNGKSLR